MPWLVQLAPSRFVGTKAAGEKILQFWGLATPRLRAATLVRLECYFYAGMHEGLFGKEDATTVKVTSCQLDPWGQKK